MLQPTKFWPEVCHVVGRPELADDPRFATMDAIAENSEAGIQLLQEAFGARPLSEWTEILGALSGPWAPVQDTLQAAADPQVAANEYILPAGELSLVSSPVQFDESAPELGPAPSFAAQTDDVLLELGLDWDRIIELKTAGAVT